MAMHMNLDGSLDIWRYIIIFIILDIKETGR